MNCSLEGKVCTGVADFWHHCAVEPDCLYLNLALQLCYGHARPHGEQWPPQWITPVTTPGAATDTITQQPSQAAEADVICIGERRRTASVSLASPTDNVAFYICHSVAISRRSITNGPASGRRLQRATSRRQAATAQVISALQANSAPTLCGTGHEYRPKCGDALRLGIKGRTAHSIHG